MKELQFTLYEILGYAIPGFVALAGLYLMVVSLLEPRLTSLVGTTFRVLVGMAVAGYIIGHCAHALANIIARRLKMVELAVADVPESIRSALLLRFAKLTPGKAFPELSLYETCDALVTQYGDTDLRDVYVYREGFYRGLTVALPLLAVGVACNWAQWPWWFKVPSHAFFVAGITVVLGASVLTFQRYTRFVKYRVQNSIFGAAVCLVANEERKSA
jgi:hypothetical protein